MRTPLLVLSMLLLVSASLYAGPDEQVEKIDTLIIEPREAGDLPEAVAAWLEERDLLIPLPWEEGLPDVPGFADSNTIAGSFITPGQRDIAVLIVHRKTINAGYELWVFPAGDTLAADKIGPVDSADYDWLVLWWPTFRNETQLRFAWRIELASPQYIHRFKERTPNADMLPELTHDGIHINIGDKPYGSFYYFDRGKWILISYLG